MRRPLVSYTCILILIIIAMTACTESSSSVDSESKTGGPIEPPPEPQFTLQFLKDCLSGAQVTGCPAVKEEESTKAFTASPTDILFILDESCSMATIANNVKEGFASLQSNVFPDSTKMAVTYMSPVQVSSAGVLDFAKPFNKNVNSLMPGHMKLVSKNSIQSYVTAVPAQASSFPVAGCDDEWFDPHAVNGTGVPCLSAAVQLAPICTGTEAGLVSAEQLMIKMKSEGKQLFREKAFVNIIFVSDTHEPGSNYFGLPMAPAAQRDAEAFLSIVYENNPNISSVKLAGILPLPLDGDPMLSGLKVIGPAPVTPEEAKVGNEGTYGYSYLPLIRAFNGAVSHAKSNDWSAVAQSLIDDTKYTGSMLVALPNVAKKIFFVLVNGATVPSTDFHLSLDRKNVVLNYASPTNINLDIEVLFE